MARRRTKERDNRANSDLQRVRGIASLALRSAPANVQALVELFIQLLLLGIERRHSFPFSLLRLRIRRELWRVRPQMTDRRLGDGGRRAGIRNRATADDDAGGNERSEE